MTINMAVWRPTFVVLGADRLRSRRDEETVVAVAVGTHTKIVLHATLPLALAVGGQAFIPVDSTTPVTDHLEAVLAQIKTSRDLSMGVLVELLKSRLDSALPLAAIAPLPEWKRNLLRVDVLIGFVCDRGASLGFLRIGWGHKFELIAEAALMHSGSLRSFYDAMVPATRKGTGSLLTIKTSRRLR